MEGKIIVMYVRWKKNIRKTTKSKKNTNVTYYAVIVKSLRQNRRIKQKFIKYLGSIREDNLDSERCRNLFWKNVSEKLGTLELSKKDKASITNKLRQVVPMSNHGNSISPKKFLLKLDRKHIRDK